MDTGPGVRPVAPIDCDCVQAACVAACAGCSQVRSFLEGRFASMPLSSRHDNPILDQIARDTFALFPHCHRCGIRIECFEDADVRVHVQRVVHRGDCPAPHLIERLLPPERDPRP